MISERLFQKGFQVWLDKVDLILHSTHGKLRQDYDSGASWLAMYKLGYLATTAVYEATKGRHGSVV